MENKRGWTKVSNFAELREKLTPEPEKIVHNFLADIPPRKPSRVPKPEPVSKVSTPSGSVRVHDFRNKHTDLGILDAKVRNLAAQIEVRLAYVQGGKAVWNKIRADHYKLNKNRRAALPNNIVALLADLQETKQRYILLREVKRYKLLLRSLPEWNLARVANVIEASQRKRVVAPSQKPKPASGVEGYFSRDFGRDLSKKRYWFAEE